MDTEQSEYNENKSEKLKTIEQEMQQTKVVQLQNHSISWLFFLKARHYYLDQFEFQEINVAKPIYENSEIQDIITISTTVDLQGKMADNLRCIVSTLVGNKKTLVGRSEIIRKSSVGNFSRKYNLQFDFTVAQSIVFDIIDLDCNYIESEAKLLGSAQISIKSIVFMKKFPIQLPLSVDNQTTGQLMLDFHQNNSDRYVMLQIAAQHLKELMDTNQKDQLYLRVLAKQSTIGVKAFIETIEPQNHVGKVLKVEMPQQKLKQFLPDIEELLYKNLHFKENDGVVYEVKKTNNPILIQKSEALVQEEVMEQ